MLTFSVKKTQKVEFKLEMDGKEETLFFTTNTIADTNRIVTLQQPYLKKHDKDSKAGKKGEYVHSEDERSEALNLARVMCSIKDEKGNYFFDGKVEDMIGVFNGDMFWGLLGQCNEVNPLPFKSDKDGKQPTVEDKKK